MEFAAIMGGFKTAAGIFGAFSQRGLDEEQTQLEYEDNLEKIRRRKFTQEQTLGQTKAFSEVAGVLHTGGSTAQGVIDTMSSEFRKELAWMQKYAITAKRLGIKRAKSDFSANIFGSIAGGVQTYAGMKG